MFFKKNKDLSNVDKSSEEVSVDKNCFMFANKILGYKEIPYDLLTLIVNDYLNNTLNVIYDINGEKNTISIPFSNIKFISFESKVRMTNSSKKTEDNQFKSILLSAAFFGGNPLVQLAGGSAFNSVFDALSSNYEKMKLRGFAKIKSTIIN